MGVLRGQKLKNLGRLPTGWTDRRQIWHTYNADSSGHERRLKKNDPIETPGGVLGGLCGQKYRSGKCGQNGWTDCRMMYVGPSKPHHQ